MPGQGEPGQRSPGGRSLGGHLIHWCHTLIHLSVPAQEQHPHAPGPLHKHTLLNGGITTFPHTHTQQDGEVTVTYFSCFQKDLSLLLVLPLLLDSLKLLEEAKLRADVCRLLVALIILTSVQRGNYCNGNIFKLY